MVKTLSKKDLEAITASGGKVTPDKQEPALEDPVEPNAAEQAVINAAANVEVATKTSVELGEKISANLALNTSQTEHLGTMLKEALLAVEVERNKKRRVIFNREKSGDRLIESADIITLAS